MKIQILFLLLIIVSCENPTPTNIILPSDQSTPDEKQILMRVLNKIQGDFDEITVNVNLLSIPYSVTTSLPSEIAGICIYKANGDPVGIAINKKVFHEWSIESSGNYGFIYKVLLHEIGHCFFRREHDPSHLSIPLDLMDVSSIDLSVMIVGGLANTPKILWPYYVREVAGLDRINCVEDLEGFLSNTNI